MQLWERIPKTVLEQRRIQEGCKISRIAACDDEALLIGQKVISIKHERHILRHIRVDDFRLRKILRMNDLITEDFFRPKIVYGQFQDSAEYSFAESGIFLSSNEYLLITRTYSEKCLLSFLNSKVSEWLLGQITGNLGGNAKIGQKSNFLKLAVITLPAQRQRQYEDIVDEILNLKAKCKDTSLLEKQIDMMIYNDYGLSIDEIQLIESQ